MHKPRLGVLTKGFSSPARRVRSLTFVLSSPATGSRWLVDGPGAAARRALCVGVAQGVSNSSWQEKMLGCLLLEGDWGLSASFHVIPVEPKYIRGTGRGRESPKQREHASLTNTEPRCLQLQPGCWHLPYFPNKMRL